MISIAEIPYTIEWNSYDNELRYVLSTILSGVKDGQWDFDNWGDPELWKWKDRLFRKEGRVLDLGIGSQARASMVFAMHGMAVDGYDIDKNRIDALNAIISSYRLPISPKIEDVRSANLGTERYDLVVMSNLFIHFPSKRAAYQVLEKALSAAKPGGYVWLRTAGKEDESYGYLAIYAYEFPHEVAKVDDDVFMAPCSCSGKWRIEPQLYFDQTELLEYLLRHNFKIRESRILPDFGKRNFMYGEDWERMLYEKSGAISILGQKLLGNNHSRI